MKKVMALSRELIVLCFALSLMFLCIVSYFSIKEIVYFWHDSKYAFTFLIWNIGLIIASIPCFIALKYGHQLTFKLENEKVFNHSTLELIINIFKLTKYDLLFIASFLVLTTFSSYSHPFGVIILCIICIIGLVLLIVFYVIKELLHHAILLQEESELTI